MPSGMTRALALAVVVVAVACLADPIMRHHGVRLGPVVSLDCPDGGGLTCGRNAALGRGTLSCDSASELQQGCVNTGTQKFAGIKEFVALADGGTSFYIGNDGVYTQDVWNWNVVTDPFKFNFTGLEPGAVTAFRMSTYEPWANIDSRILSLGTNGKATYVEHAYVTADGTVGAADIEGSDGGWAVNGTAVEVAGHTLPTVNTLCAFSDGEGDFTGWPADPTVRELAVHTGYLGGEYRYVYSTMTKKGASDGGTSADGGTQSYYIGIYNRASPLSDGGTGAWLCKSTGKACGSSTQAWTTDFCNLDGGGTYSGAVVHSVAIDDSDCLVKPRGNICLYIKGPPSP